MEHQELTDLKSVLLAEPANDSEGLSMSVEGKTLDLEINCNQITEDAAHFERFGIDWQDRVAKITMACKALRSAEILFTADAKLSEEADEIWRDNRAPLYHWRDESVARLKHLAKRTDNKALQVSLDKIGEADGHPDAIQDTFEATHLVDVHFDDLAVHNLTVERVNEGKAILDLCANAYPHVAADDSKISPAKDLRNRAFWYLVKLERELKENDLPLVFFDNYVRRMEYGSHYKRESRLRKKNEQ